MIDLDRCPVCDTPASRAPCVFAMNCSYEGKPFSNRVVRCSCRHAFLNPRPSWEEILSFYDHDYP